MLCYLSLHELNIRSTSNLYPNLTNLEKKWHDWSLIMMFISYLCNDMWAEQQVVKFVLYTFSYSYYYTEVTDIWIALLRTGIFKQIMYIRTVQSESFLYIHTGVGKSRFTVLNLQNRVHLAIVMIITCISFYIWTTINLLLPNPVYAFIWLHMY